MADKEVVPAKTKKKNSDPVADMASSSERKDSEKKAVIDSLGVALGTDQNLPFTSPYLSVSQQAGTTKKDDEKLVEVIKDESEEWGPTVRQLVAMRRGDGQARALYRLLTLPIRAALSQATFVPDDDGEIEAEFIEQVFTLAPAQGGMSVTFHRFMSQLLQGLFDGFSAFEKVFWVPDNGPLEGKITLQKLAHRPSETISFITDDRGGFAGLRQRAHINGKQIDVRIPPEQAFYYAAQEEERKFYGVSFFQSAFYHYDKKVKLYFIAHVAAQRAAVGTRVGKVPANATNTAKQEFVGAMNNLALAQWMAMPEGFEVDILKEGGSYDFLSMINHHNSQMSKSVLAAFLDKEQGAGASEGSLVNFAQPGDEMFTLMLRAIMDDIANQINHYIIPQLIDYNFKDGKYPKFVWGTLTDEQREAVSSTFDKVMSARPDAVTPEFFRALEEHVAAEMGLDIDYAEVEMREEEEAAAEASIDPMTGLPREDPAEGEIPAGGEIPADGEIPAEGAIPEAGAVPPATGKTPPAAPSAAPAAAPTAAPTAARAAAAPADPNQPPAAEVPDPNITPEMEPGAELGLSGDWGLDEFMDALAKADPAVQNVELTESEEAGLIRLAHEMLDMATEDINA